MTCDPGHECVDAETLQLLDHGDEVLFELVVRAEDFAASHAHQGRFTVAENVNCLRSFNTGLDEGLTLFEGGCQGQNQS